MFSKKQRDRVEEMEPYATFVKKYNKLSNPINQKVHLKIKATKEKDGSGFIDGFYLEYGYTKWFDLLFQFYSLIDDKEPPNIEFCIVHSLSYKFEYDDYFEVMMDTIDDIQKRSSSFYISSLVHSCEVNCFLNDKNVVTVTFKVFCDKQDAKEVCLQLINTDIALFARTF